MTEASQKILDYGESVVAELQTQLPLEPLTEERRVQAIEELLRAWNFLHSEWNGDALKSVRLALSCLGHQDF